MSAYGEPPDDENDSQEGRCRYSGDRESFSYIPSLGPSQSGPNIHKSYQTRQHSKQKDGQECLPRLQRKDLIIASSAVDEHG